MVIHDKVYSTYTINSPIALELINTDSLQRLKGISQFGLPNKYYHLNGYSRYEHSIGVYILLHTLGATEEEQIAGLLHDISHTAFSHVVDWVFGNNENEDYQDTRHISVLRQAELHAIVSKYGYQTDRLADYHHFGLLEKDLPDLCADRIDYALRECERNIAERCLKYVQVWKGELVFSTEDSALLFAETFLEKQREHWAGYEAITRYSLLSGVLRQAMKEHNITFEDLLQTDDYMIDKLLKTKDERYLNVLKVLEHKNLNFLPKSKNSVKKKFRHVDPKIIVHGKKVVRLSEINKQFAKHLRTARELNTHKIFPGKLLIDTVPAQTAP